MVEEPQLTLGLQDQRRVFTVSDLTGGLRELVETAFDDFHIEGELSNFKRHRSGHCYFTLKDENAQIRCVMWRHFTRYVFFEPQDGMLVRIRGSASVYEARGDLQILARSMRLAGEGGLQKAFEELKRKLAAEGLFERERKKPLPSFPETIGVVTSGSGAALHDILSVLQRRFPVARVVLCPVQVQGIGSAAEIARAVRCLNDQFAGSELRPDVMIVGRGGGSLEDLWAFNEEVVARALAESDIPVISAVGHETDVSIADFVADQRAATPSMAAEIAVPDQAELRAWLHGSVDAARGCIERSIGKERQRVAHLMRTRAFNRPADRLRQLAQRLDGLEGRLHREVRRALEQRRTRVQGCLGRLTLLDPSRPLERGYARVQRDGRHVTSAAALNPDDAVTLTFADGERGAVIR